MTNKTFDQYVKQFNLKDPDLKGKYEHSYRVQTHAYQLAKSLKLNKQKCLLASLAGLLHDIGRFDQFTNDHTFIDNRHFDHAKYGYYLLMNQQLIKDYHIDPKDYKIVSLAVLEHNRYKLEKRLTVDEQLIANIVRDADKIDILERFITIHDIPVNKVTNYKLSKEVKTCYNQQMPIKKQYLKQEADHILFLLAFVYDLNFYYSFDYIYHHDLIYKYYKQLGRPKALKKYFDAANDYVVDKVARHILATLSSKLCF